MAVGYTSDAIKAVGGLQAQEPVTRPSGNPLSASFAGRKVSDTPLTPPHTDFPLLKKYKKGKKIGEGNFGRVYMAKPRQFEDDDQWQPAMVIKKMIKDPTESRSRFLVDVSRECRMQQSVGNKARIYDALWNPVRKECQILIGYAGVSLSRLMAAYNNRVKVSY